ncbi:MAG: GNAT family protein [Bacteroidota bacterium]
MEEYSITLLREDQSDLFFDVIQANRSRLEDFFAGTLAHTKTRADAISYCKEIQERIKQKTYFPYVITHISHPGIVGLIDVKNIDWGIPKAELGAFIDVSFEGKGIITTHLKQLVEYIVSMHGFKKLLCRISPENYRSIKVAQSCGFQLEGTIRRDYRTTCGTVVDLNYYGRIF